MKLIVGLPLYHHLPAPFFSNWLAMDKTDVAGTITVDGVYITSAMDMIVTRALQYEGWDRLVILEHDMIPPPDALARIARYPAARHIVGSFYFRHERPHTAVIYMEQPAMTYRTITPATVKDWADTRGLYRCDAVGFGLTSITREVLENWDQDIPMFHMDADFRSHDLWFCHHARKQGFEVFVDSGVCCDHLTQTPVGYANNQAPDAVAIDRISRAAVSAYDGSSDDQKAAVKAAFGMSQ